MRTHYLPFTLALATAIPLAAQNGRVYTDGTQVASLTFVGSLSRAPALAADELYLVFSDNRGGNYDLFETARPTIGAAWGPPTRLPGLSTARDDLAGDISQDGLELVYVQQQGTRADIFMTRRQSIGQPWGAPLALPAPINGANVRNGLPRLSQDALTMYFPRSVNGNAAEVAVVQRTARNQPFGTPTRFAPAGTIAGDKLGVMVEGNGHRIWFSTQPIGGAFAWYFTHRDTAGQWISPVLVPELGVREGEATIGKTTRRMLQVDLTPVSIFELCGQDSNTTITYCVDTEWVAFPCPAPPGTYVYQMVWEYETGTVTDVNSYDWRPWLQTVWVASLTALPSAVPVPGFLGALLIDPSNMVVLGAVPPVDGMSTLPFRLPRNPGLVGLVPVLQAVRFDSAGNGSLSHSAALRIVR